MKPGKFFLITTLVLFVFLISITVFHFSTSFPDDFGTFVLMRDFLTAQLGESGADEKSGNTQFEKYFIRLNPLYKFMFKTDKLSLYLKSYETDILDTATISQFEIGEDSGIFFDFTFMLRPQAEYSMPFFHGDALKALPGVDGALYMDFYSFDNTMDAAEFFGGRIEKIEQARKLAEPYWKHEGFGELTHHLDEFKSSYRFEIIKPEKASEEDKKLYFETAYSCFRLYTEAYLESIQAHSEELNPAEAEQNKKNIEHFVEILYQHDVAVKMGKKIFPPEDFDSYFLDGFWGIKD